MKRICAAVIAAWLVPAHSIVLGGSNLGIFGYPDMTCVKPIKPSPPYSRDPHAVRSYNADVDSYNSQIEVFVGCVRSYLENSKNDIDRIRERMQEAVAKAKRDF